MCIADVSPSRPEFIARTIYQGSELFCIVERGEPVGSRERRQYSSDPARLSHLESNCRGGTIGPDRTHIGRVDSRERIITSILQPSQEKAPHHEPWIPTTDFGTTRPRPRLAKAGEDGIEPYADAEGIVFTLPSESVEDRAASDVSIMPDGLERTLSIEDLPDLVPFLVEGDKSRE